MVVKLTFCCKRLSESLICDITFPVNCTGYYFTLEKFLDIYSQYRRFPDLQKGNIRG